jgi:hypothetical protein
MQEQTFVTQVPRQQSVATLQLLPKELQHRLVRSLQPSVQQSPGLLQSEPRVWQQEPLRPHSNTGWQQSSGATQGASSTPHWPGSAHREVTGSQ